MHELSATQTILDTVLKHARLAGAMKIRQVNLCLGELSDESDESILFYWGIVTRGTEAEGANLHFRRVPAEFQCPACSKKHHSEGKGLPCPDCGSAQVIMLAGEEFNIESIDID